MAVVLLSSSSYFTSSSLSLFFWALLIVFLTDLHNNGRSSCTLVEGSIAVNVQHFVMDDLFAQELPWTVRVSGDCGAKGNTPRRMYSKACNDQLIVAWAAQMSNTDPNNITVPTDSYGKITTYTVSSTGVFTLVSDYMFSWCNDMGAVEVNSDCSVISVLCRSRIQNMTGAYNFVLENRDSSGNYQFGWYAASQPNPSEANYRLVDSMYLLEWNGGIVTQVPNRITIVSEAIGGWNFGHWESSLNKDSSAYYFALKTTLFGNGEWHEGETNYVMSRIDRTYLSNLSPGWACGTGHVLANRVVYNTALDVWSRFCLTDYNNEQIANYWAITWGTITNTSSITLDEIILLSTNDRTVYTGYGGPIAIISRGTSGFFAVGVGPGGSAPDNLGFINLPGVALRDTTFTPKEYLWNWLNFTPKNGYRIGLVNAQNIGPGGEDSNRILIGWSWDVQLSGGLASEFWLTEIDSSGCSYGIPQFINTTGWGEDNNWVYMPNSGCVVWPYAWLGESLGLQYGVNGEPTFTNRMSMTSVCPGAVTSSCYSVKDESGSGVVIRGGSGGIFVVLMVMWICLIN